MKYFAGIDVGSLTAKAVLIDENKSILGYYVQPIGYDSLASGTHVLEQVLKKAGLKQENITGTVTTGYSRKRFSESAIQKTEISCHAKGISIVFPQARTLIDVGGQDSKVMKIGNNGKVLDFAMNDKCAAGTGRFVEVMAHALGLSLNGISDSALNHSNELLLSSTCTVFAESEIVSLLSQGNIVPDISWAIMKSIADRVAALVGRVGTEKEVAMSGGMAKNQALVQRLADKLATSILVPEEPQIIGALGAAVIAMGQ
ncbi:MAG: acyl-CoA dehydratase activase [Deltaproteobacteria bacterium]|nr:acyl-CoA dehydratase activase [Deltaproteobacteria bacterium]MCL5791661.1 acyl-CoA dehydratase activase [Deltaproteobacteria bacterium]